MVKLRGLTGRLAVTVTAVAIVVGVSASPAAAAVEVRADKPRAGATNVIVSFLADARSQVSGIAFLRVTLPSGIDSSDVELVAAPDGWQLSTTPEGYNVGGPPLEVGEDALYRVRIDRLPSNVRQLPFKTLQQYSDGRAERDDRVPVLVLSPPRQAAPPPQQPPAPRPEPVQPPPQPEQPPVQSPIEVPPTTEAPLPTYSPSYEPPLVTEPPPSSVATAPLSQQRPLPPLWVWIAVAVGLAVAGQLGYMLWARRRRGPSRHHA